MKDKILSEKILLTSGEPLITAPIKAMCSAKTINDFVIVGKKNQCEQLEKIANTHANEKKFKIIENEGHVGETITKGSQEIQIPGYFFIVQADLPFIDGDTIDFAIIELLNRLAPNLGICFPAITKEFFQIHKDGWKRSFFPKLISDGNYKRFKSLDFAIMDSSGINPEFLRKLYNIRMIKSLIGKINIVRHFTSYIPKIMLKYGTASLSIKDIEEIGSELNGKKIQIIEVFNPIYAAFMKDIDTRGDYRAYLKSSMT